ncbi:MAG TPA: DUF134 domain-containing protein [Spirochaetia bacterium]|nr:DUF134 domain-containing protein [Spirochaetia bacterium]
MTRRKIPRCIRFSPKVSYFKPQGTPLRLLEEVNLGSDEIEAIRLYEVDHISQTIAAEKMKISQPTFARILDSANQKIADALINGKAIRIEQS